MAGHTTRVSYDEFSADVAGFLDRVAQRGERVEVLWRDGAVALVRPGNDATGTHARQETVAELVDRWRRPPARSASSAPTPEQIARRRAAIRRGEALGARLSARRGGSAPPSNLELIHHEQDERTVQIDPP